MYRASSATSWDAIVVGGGPGGSTAAWALARGGARVLLLDACRFPRVKLCAGWVTRRVWRALELDPASYPHTIQPFDSARLAVDGAFAETRWGRVVGYGIVRCQFDHFLLRRAEEAGATVREGRRVGSVERRGELVTLEAGADDVRAPVVIGAGGHHCPVARAFGAIPADESVVIARESETRLGAERIAALTDRPGTPDLYAEPDFRGYAWFFAKGDFLNLGIGRIGDGRELRHRATAWLEELRGTGRLRDDVALEPFRGHAYAIRAGAARRAAGPGFLLVGDAAGLARPISGEGIGPAVESARLAAEATLSEPRHASEAYAAALEAGPGGGAPRLASAMADRLPRPAIEWAARAVCRSAPLRRRLLFEKAFAMG